MNRALRALTVGLALVAATACGTGRRDYPPVHRDATVDTYFGVRIPAPYQWMENPGDPELRAWVAAENRLTATYLARIPVRAWLERRLTQLWNNPTETVPDQLRNGMQFFRRNTGLQNQSVVYVRSTPTAKARVLLDPNRLSADGSIALVSVAPSLDGKYLAYALSTGGSDWETIHVLDVATSRVLPDTVRWVKFSGIAWTRDDRGFFYSRFTQPPAGQAALGDVVDDQKLDYHTLGTPQADDRPIFARPSQPHAFVTAGFVQHAFCDDGRYLFVSSDAGWTANELYYADLGDPRKPDLAAPVKTLYGRDDAAYRPVGCRGDTLYLRTTLDAPRGRIVATRFADPDPAHWRVVVPQAAGVLADATLADGRILASYADAGESRLVLFDTTGKRLQTLPLPGPGTVAAVSARADSPRVYYAFTSFLAPTAIYAYDVAQRATTTVFKPKLAFDAAAYTTRQAFYESKDGTRVPMFIVARKHLRLDGSHPTLLYGYGGFGASVTPEFSAAIPAWLELGGVYAVAEIRGGDAYGQAWHRAGMLGNKQNVFDDFAWAAKYLVSQGYTSPHKLGIEGYSNGGLLTAVSINQHPQWFGAAYIGHGVLDMLRYQKFSGGAFWVPEYGSADDAAAFHWLLKYSPLQNIRRGACYPPTLITTSWDDDRVVPSHAFKFAAKLQHAQACTNPILLRTTGATSHMYMPTRQLIQQDADVWAFEANSLGIRRPPRSGD